MKTQMSLKTERREVSLQSGYFLNTFKVGNLARSSFFLLSMASGWEAKCLWQQNRSSVVILFWFSMSWVSDNLHQHTFKCLICFLGESRAQNLYQDQSRPTDGSTSSFMLEMCNTVSGDKPPKWALNMIFRNETEFENSKFILFFFFFNKKYYIIFV